MLALEKYMLVNENINNLISNNLNTNPSKKEFKEFKECKKIKNSKNPEPNDKLFFIIYNLVNDNFDDHINFRIEKEFKIKSIEKLREIKQKLKIYKFKLTEIEDKLLNCQHIDLQTFFALCLLYEKNIFFIWENKFYEFNCCENQVIIIKNYKEETFNLDKIQYFKENYYQVLNINKQIKSCASYTKDELKIIAKKLGIDNIELKKNDLYEKIMTKF